MFLSAECYEWAFMLALVIRNLTIINEIIYSFKISTNHAHFSANFVKGLSELHSWAKIEW